MTPKRLLGDPNEAVVSPLATPSAVPSHTGTFRADIQGLRAIAVLAVVANHAGVPGLAGGYIGVDVFFVISGYVITQLLMREAGKGMRRGLADFYSRRVRRIMPASAVALVATVLFAEWLSGGRLSPNLPGDVRWASLFSANFRLIRTGSNYFVPGIQPSLITQFWSLAVEEQFYLVFPLVVLLIARFVPFGCRRRALAGALGVGVVISAWWSVHLSAVAPATAYYSPFTRFWELGLGCLLATLTVGRRTGSSLAGRLAAVAGLVLLAVSFLELSSTSVYPGWRAWLPCGASALLIWSGSVGGSTPSTRLLSQRPLVFIGNISYSLYLSHYVWLMLPAQLSPALTGPGWRIAEVAGALATAMASYYLIENPIRRSVRLADDRFAVVLLACVCIAASWAGAAVAARLA